MVDKVTQITKKVILFYILLIQLLRSGFSFRYLIVFLYPMVYTLDTRLRNNYYDNRCKVISFAVTPTHAWPSSTMRPLSLGNFQTSGHQRFSEKGHFCIAKTGANVALWSLLISFCIRDQNNGIMRCIILDFLQVLNYRFQFFWINFYWN